MKKFYYIILLLCTMQQIYGQQALDGIYTVDLAKTVALMEGDNKQKYDSLDSSVKERARQSMDGRVFVFRAGGQLEVRWNANGSGKFTEGTWEMKDKEILLIKIGEQVTEYLVIRPTATGLVLKNEGGRGFFSNLYLESSE
ncbi:MAG: hypothetical protein KF803_10555 [Cyclobacteriaceae bacterium]|nr:hypothetical protein [Cyclobacteriaceae bacterium]